MSKWKKVALWKKILIGVVIGLIIGLVSPKAAEVISPLGDIFLRMLKMLIVPLVFFSITVVCARWAMSNSSARLASAMFCGSWPPR